LLVVHVVERDHAEDGRRRQVEQLAHVVNRLRRNPSPHFLRQMQRGQQRRLPGRISRQDVIEARFRLGGEQLDALVRVGKTVGGVGIVGSELGHYQSNAFFFQTYT